MQYTESMDNTFIVLKGITNDRGVDMKLINREKYIQFLRNHREKRVIKIVSGVRRCGKSTLFYLFQQELLQEGVNENQIIAINFEDLEYRDLTDYIRLYEYIKSKIIPNQQMYIFLDEVQHVQGFERVVDSFYIKDNVDIYITGSNAYFMSSEMATLLAGRYVQLDMLPLSFKEFVEAHKETTNLSLNGLYRLFVAQSGFPGTLEYAGHDEMLHTYLEGIVNSVVLKDVMTRLKGSDILILESIILYIAANVGSLLTPKKIADSLTSMGRKVDSRTVERYIAALRDALLIYEASRFDVRGKELLRLYSKFYLVDPGLRRFFVPNTGRDTGHILENVVYLELLRRGYTVHVGILKNGEIDFVAQKHGLFEYYQVSQSVLDPTTLDRELTPLFEVKDYHPKFLLTLDEINSNASYEGIQQKNVIEWLLE